MSTATITLLPASAPDLTGGQEVSVPGGAQARLSVGDGGLSLRVRAHEGPVAELRWLVDSAVRKVSKAVSLADAPVVYVSDGVDAARAEAVCLDLHTRFGARLEHGLGPDVARIGASEDLYRRWVNEDPTLRTSLQIASDVEAFAAQHDDVSVEIFDEAALAEAGMNLILAVGGASQVSPPRLVIARYRPRGASGPPTMLLGKGITFDSGGINVKPYESFVSMMKNDMGGAALAWSLFAHLVEYGWDRPLTVVLPTCENPVGENAMRPGALVKSYRGPVVRIDHTDAEGRLVLADGLAWASEHDTPAQVLSFATLTTAALIAYGPYATPVHFASDAWRAALEGASAQTGEDLHFFPRRVWHFEANRDEEADLRNTARLPGNARRGAGSRNAGHFLLHFTDAPLMHFDIFASTWNWAGDAPGVGYGATGAPLRTLVRGFERFAAG